MKFTLSNVFSGASTALGRGFVPLLLATLLLYILPYAVMYGVTFLLTGHMFGGPGALQGGQVVISIVEMLIGDFLLFLHMGAIYEICILAQANKPVKLGEVCAHALGNLFPIFLIYLLCLVGWVVCGVLIIIPALIFGVVFSVVIPAYVAEKPGIFGAFSRSRVLTKGHRWGIFGLWVLMVVVFYIVLMVLEVPIMMPIFQASMKAAQTGHPIVQPDLPWVLLAVVSVVFSAFWVVMLSINASVYSCLRAEKDRFNGASVEKVFE